MATGSGSTRSIQNISCIALVVLRMACFATPCANRRRLCATAHGEGRVRHEMIQQPLRTGSILQRNEPFHTHGLKTEKERAATGANNEPGVLSATS